MMGARYLLFVRKDCPACRMLAPVIREAEAAGRRLVAFTQDDADFLGPETKLVDDRSLERSYRRKIRAAPTLIRMEADAEVARTEGWKRAAWREILDLPELGSQLPSFEPGCGSRSVEPGTRHRLRALYGKVEIGARRVELDEWSDPVEVCYQRGWTDGLPVVAPTPERILAMLEGTTRDPRDIVGRIPPNLSPCTVEKVAINAVLAGCLPEYLPVVLAAVEASLDPRFTLHGVTCSTCFSSPIIIVNGPIATSINMNSGGNALGPGNRANATIGRALNLVVRNVGGGRPGEIDRATLGGPGKYAFCFAEDESDPNWESLAASRGVPPPASAVTLFAGDGIQGVHDYWSRTPEELTRSLADALSAVGHPSREREIPALLVICPEHYRVYRDQGFGREEITHALVSESRLRANGGAGARKFSNGGLVVARAGGRAGMFSAILAGWPGDRRARGSHLATRRVSP